MRLHISYISFLSLILLQGLNAQVGELIWEDNFNRGELDLTKWTIETGTGVNGDFGTGQIDRATDRSENIDFQDNIEGSDDGCLVITTRKEWYIDRNYTSGRIISKDKSSWGPGHRIVAKVLPRDVKQIGQGFAFWMMPDEIPAGWDYIMWPQGGEVDIMEYVGSIPHHNLASVHYAWFWENNEWQSWNHGHSGFYYSYNTKQVPNPSEPGYGNYPPEDGDINAGSTMFHEYGIDWYDDRMEFFIDDTVYHIHYFNDGGYFQKDGEDEKKVVEIDSKQIGISEYSNHFEEWQPFEKKMFLILSAGVGGSDNTYGGKINSDAVFPCSVFIDWVKVYKLDNNMSHNDDIKLNTKVYPNPSKGLISIEYKDLVIKKICVFSSTGQKIMENINIDNSQINLSELKSGVYILRFQSDRGSISKQIILE